ncbi:glycosyltransferase family 87 protein [Micrococcoides hystricis]|uniref:Glycosyltransferase family 87 protein n=1 Tax=Micrococcoides hystricis TaxID=1572761 RepID=A0ABV6PBA9_9MICC
MFWTALAVCALGWAVIYVASKTGSRITVLRVLLLMGALAATTVVAQHLVFGQINVFLAIMCLYDLTANPDRRPRFLPRGLLTGVAAGIKLTPGFFLLYLLVTRQFRAAAWMTASGGHGFDRGIVVPQGKLRVLDEPCVFAERQGGSRNELCFEWQ